LATIGTQGQRYDIRRQWQDGFKGVPLVKTCVSKVRDHPEAGSVGCVENVSAGNRCPWLASLEPPGRCVPPFNSGAVDHRQLIACRRKKNLADEMARLQVCDFLNSRQLVHRHHWGIAIRDSQPSAIWRNDSFA